METARYLEPTVRSDLDRKMVFVAGPRQVGKITMANRILDQFGTGRHLTWDRRQDRDELRAAR